ncbi:MAG: hypothetical protein HC862_25750 [Scytonema sp. RU_4_4]|nr:hypothetical protein [Scytonema sp. RU_4_4]NJR72790.1 hypothetical protein [Scytonema sp. CRU_2_7]
MPTIDIYYDTIKNTFIKDDWTITHDPLGIRLARGRNLFVDLGAERLLPAERSSSYLKEVAGKVLSSYVEKILLRPIFNA